MMVHEYQQINMDIVIAVIKTGLDKVMYKELFKKFENCDEYRKSVQIADGLLNKDKYGF